MYFRCVNNLSSAFCHGFLICELLFITIVSDHDFLISNVTQCGSCHSFIDIFLKNCHVNLAWRLHLLAKKKKMITRRHVIWYEMLGSLALLLFLLFFFSRYSPWKLLLHFRAKESGECILNTFNALLMYLFPTFLTH